MYLRQPRVSQQYFGMHTWVMAELAYQLDSQQMLMQLLTGVAYQPDGMCIVCGTCRSATYLSRQPTAHQYYQQAVW